MSKKIPLEFQVLNRLALFHQRIITKTKDVKVVQAKHINECPFWKKGDPGLFSQGLSCDDLCHKLFNCTTCPCDYFGAEGSLKRLEELLRREGMM